MSVVPPPHSFLTALSPIEHRANDPDGRLRGVREALHTHEQLASPLRECPMAHMVRLQIIDSLRPAMGDVDGRTLKSSYLLFVVELDGEIADFLDCLYRVGDKFVDSVWGRCEGYPAYRGAVFFRRYIQRCLITNPIPYAAFATPVDGILRALARKESLADWACRSRGLDDAALQRQWLLTRGALQRPIVPKPGTL